MDKKIVNKAYDWLKENAYGEENGKSLSEIASIFLTSANKRLMRKIISEINNDSDLGLISTSKKIYLCKTEEECQKAIKTTYRLALSCLKKARKMGAKIKLNGQYEFVDNDGKKIRIVYES
jgi:hypothetical protein